MVVINRLDVQPGDPGLRKSLSAEDRSTAAPNRSIRKRHRGVAFRLERVSVNERSPDTVGIRQPAPDVAAEDIGRAAMRLRSSGGGHPRSQGATVPRNRVVRYVGHPSVRASDSYHPGVPHGRAPNSGTGDTVSAHPDASPSRAAGQRASFDYDAFISYTHHDRPVAAGIQKWMRRRQRSGPRVSQRSAPTSTFWAGVGVDLVSLSTARTESSS